MKNNQDVEDKKADIGIFKILGVSSDEANKRTTFEVVYKTNSNVVKKEIWFFCLWYKIKLLVQGYMDA